MITTQDKRLTNVLHDILNDIDPTLVTNYFYEFAEIARSAIPTDLPSSWYGLIYDEPTGEIFVITQHSRFSCGLDLPSPVPQHLKPCKGLGVFDRSVYCTLQKSSRMD